ncbi:NAD(P)-binding protein, partial [Gautieria morchelliformis]
MSSPMPSRRAAIVTGAAQGIGRAIALRLAQDGYDMAVNDLSRSSAALETLAEEIRTKGRKAIAVYGDISKEEVVQTLVDQTLADLGELYIMVANAGIATPLAPVVSTSLETWERYLSINLTGVFLCYRAAAQQMLKQGHGGRIIGASSCYGKRGEGRYAAYSATKFGVRGLTQSLATELAKERITVNAYAPGSIDTPLLSSVVRESVPASADQDAVESRLNAIRATYPMQRIGSPENIAGLVSYLASDQADFMTGQSISINGGVFYD